MSIFFSEYLLFSMASTLGCSLKHFQLFSTIDGYKIQLLTRSRLSSNGDRRLRRVVSSERHSRPRMHVYTFTQ
jgi:hypothetical protein